MQNEDKLPRAAANCSFYPACYVMGDCPHEGWREGRCGLGPEDKQIERDKDRARLAEAGKRHRIMERARRGEFDHFDIGETSRG